MRAGGSVAFGSSGNGGSTRPEVDVVGLGENSLDRVCTVTGALHEGAKLPMDDLVKQPGGQVATALLGVARLGLRCAFVSSVGDDGDAEIALSPLREAGVELDGVRVVEGAATRSAVVIVRAETGERTILWRRDARLGLDTSKLRADEIRRGRALLVDITDPDASRWAVGVAREAGRPVVLDADARWPGAESLLAQVDFPVVSKGFAEEWGDGCVLEGLAALEKLGARAAVATLGEFGAIARVEGRFVRSPAFAVEARDTTGAGDAFHAGFIWGVLAGRDVDAVLRAANAAAALNCGAFGAQGGLPDAAAVERFLCTHEQSTWRARRADGTPL